MNRVNLSTSEQLGKDFTSENVNVDKLMSLAAISRAANKSVTCPTASSQITFCPRLNTRTFQRFGLKIVELDYIDHKRLTQSYMLLKFIND